jgi:hypothetical protein
MRLVGLGCTEKTSSIRAVFPVHRFGRRTANADTTRRSQILRLDHCERLPGWPSDQLRSPDVLGARKTAARETLAMRIVETAQGGEAMSLDSAMTRRLPREREDAEAQRSRS